MSAAAAGSGGPVGVAHLEHLVEVGGELRDRGGELGAETQLIHMPHRLAQRHAVVVGERLQRGFGRRPDAALRRVHDAPQGERVGGVGDRDQVRHRILDLGPLVELGAAEHLVGQGGADEDVLQRTGLRVRAVEHGHVAVGDAGVAELADLVRDELRLVVLGVAGEAEDLVAGADRREQVLRLAVEVVGDHRVGGIQDGLGRAVVLLEQDDLRVREVALELDDVADVGATERVDRLVAVAHHGEARAGDLVAGLLVGQRRRARARAPSSDGTGLVSSRMSAYWA